ncbi:MAG: hypothetical protein HQL96_06695 [Magnetococcales bacterium]|nr:hypothetical protein [Magnetococcales bacterium]
MEQACGLAPCVYLFAGYARPGAVAFVYHPDLETDKQGEVSPFDTGGVYCGKCAPFRGAKAASAAVALIQQTRVALSGWRAGFADYLRDYFAGECLIYAKGSPPDLTTSPGWGSPDLPARHAENRSDRAAWTWEVRLHESFPVTGHLLAWSCTRDDYLNIVNRFSKEQPFPTSGFLLQNFRYVEAETFNITDTLKQFISAWIEEQCPP